MNTRMGRCLGIAVLSLCLLGTARASTVLYGADVNAPADLAYSITGFTTSGAGMAALGLQVKVFFSNGSDSGYVPWMTGVTNPITSASCATPGTDAATGCGLATGAIGNGTWVLTETGDTGSVLSTSFPDSTPLHPWSLTNTATDVAITSVELTGLSALVFDRTAASNTLLPANNGDIGTPGSAGGIDYIFNSEAGGTWTVTATYSRLLMLFGSAQPCDGPTPGVAAASGSFAGRTTTTGCGDEWGTLTFAFTAGGPFVGTGGGNNARWNFFQDTDMVGTPEPLTAVLTGIGLLAIGGIRKFRRTAR